MKLTSSVSAKRQHVHGASLVRAKDIYGFHPDEQLYIKVVLYYPQEVSRVATILQVRPPHPITTRKHCPGSAGVPTKAHITLV